MLHADEIVREAEAERENNGGVGASKFGIRGHRGRFYFLLSSTWAVI